jgi:hypothetical protein
MIRSENRSIPPKAFIKVCCLPAPAPRRHDLRRAGILGGMAAPEIGGVSSLRRAAHGTVHRSPRRRTTRPVRRLRHSWCLTPSHARRRTTLRRLLQVTPRRRITRPARRLRRPRCLTTSRVRATAAITRTRGAAPARAPRAPVGSAAGGFSEPWVDTRHLVDIAMPLSYVKILAFYAFVYPCTNIMLHESMNMNIYVSNFSSRFEILVIL